GGVDNRLGGSEWFAQQTGVLGHRGRAECFVADTPLRELRSAPGEHDSPASGSAARPWRGEPGQRATATAREDMITPRLRAARPLDAPPSAGPPGEITIAPLLDLDPSLGHALTPALHDQVRPWLVVPVWPLRRGPWPSSLTSSPGMMGLLMLDGV